MSLSASEPAPADAVSGVSLADRVRRAAREVGFDDCGIAAVEDLPAAERLDEWLQAGMHGSMGWMERTRERRADPRKVLPGARSLIMVALDYDDGHPATEAPSRGRISRYAWGGEYHDLLEERLDELARRVEALAPGARTRSYVDHGPVLEKAWAERAELGWIGKHTNLIDPERGSWFFLGAVLVDVELEPDEPPADGCGGCRRCIVACPTDAIVAPYVLDARRCISYLTIENRGPIPRDLRRPIGNRVFGCDECQDVCPWNEHASRSRIAQELEPRPANTAPRLVELLRLDDEAFRHRFEGSPVLRARRAGLVRNVAVALGNSADPTAVGPLVQALDDDDALVRGHVAWALGELGGDEAMTALRRRLEREDDDFVVEEVEAALAGCEEGSSASS